MKTLENSISAAGEDGGGLDEQPEMSETWKQVARNIEDDDTRLFGYERKEGQTHLSYIQNLRREILQMDQRELDVFEHEQLPNLSSTRNKEVPFHRRMTLMELDAINTAIQERKSIFLKQENESSFLEPPGEEEVLKEAGDIFDKVKLPEGVDRVTFAREFLLHKKDIEASRREVEELFEKIVGEEMAMVLKTELQEVTDWPALGKNPSAVMKYFKNLLEKGGVSFEDLPRDLQQELRNAVAGTSTFAVNFKSMKPAVEAIKKIEEGGYLDIEGQYVGNGGAKNPYVDLSPGDIEHLKTNFYQITEVSLRKIAGYINEPLPKNATTKEKSDKVKQIQKGIESICKQLGQERWWWARHLDQKQIDDYKSKLDALDEQLINQIKEQMIAEDLKIKLPSHRAIYNRLFGGYGEAFKKALGLSDTIKMNEAA